MFSRGRRCFEKRTAVAPFLETRTVGTNPLLFLYPPWFRAASRRGYGATPLDASRDRAISPEGGGRVLAIETPTNSSASADYDSGGKTLADGSNVLVSPLRWSPQHGIQTPGLQHGNSPLEQIVRERLKRKIGHDAQVGMTGDFFGSKAIKRVAMAKKYDPRRQFWTTHMRDLASMLARLRHLHKKKRDDTVGLSEAAIFQLTGSVNENIWIHHVGEGCKVHVLPRERSSTLKQRLVRLTGSDPAIELTRKYLTDYEMSLYSQVADEPVGFRYSAPRLQLVVKNARKTTQVLTLPRQWTVRTLAEYIKNLVTTRLTRALKRELGKNSHSYNQEVANRLQNLCTDPALEACLSSRTVNLALLFLCRHTELHSAARDVYARSKYLGLHGDINGYNILLGAALHTNDMDWFRELVSDMSDMRVLPNAATWTKLLEVTEFPWARRRLLTFALHSSTARTREMTDEIVKSLIEVEFTRRLTPAGGLQDFVSEMDQAFGAQWLTTSALNKMIIVCAENRWHQYAADVVGLAEERSVQLEGRTLIHMLKLARERGSLHEAIALLRSPVARILRPDLPSTLPLVFQIAWDKQFYNVCRVLWHCAATHGYITYRMQAMVTSSLVQNCQGSHNDKQRSRWKMLAGNIIVGTDLDTSGFQDQFPLLSKYTTSSNPMEWLGQWTPNDGTRDEQLSLSYVMLHRDLSAWKGFEPMGYTSLCTYLDEAYVSDGQWSTSGVMDNADLSFVLANCIHVPLVRRKNLLTADSLPASILPSIKAPTEDEKEDTLQESLPAVASEPPSPSPVEVTFQPSDHPQTSYTTINLDTLSHTAAASFRMHVPQLSMGMPREQPARFSTSRLLRGWRDFISARPSHSRLYQSQCRSASTATNFRAEQDSNDDGVLRQPANYSSDIILSPRYFVNPFSSTARPSNFQSSLPSVDLESRPSRITDDPWLAPSSYRQVCLLGWYVSLNERVLAYLGKEATARTTFKRHVYFAHRGCYHVRCALQILDIELIEIYHNLGRVSGERFYRIQSCRLRVDTLHEQVAATRQDVYRHFGWPEPTQRTGRWATVIPEFGERRRRVWNDGDDNSDYFPTTRRHEMRGTAGDAPIYTPWHGQASTAETADVRSPEILPQDATMQDLVSQIDGLKMESQTLRQAVELLQTVLIANGLDTVRPSLPKLDYSTREQGSSSPHPSNAIRAAPRLFQPLSVISTRHKGQPDTSQVHRRTSPALTSPTDDNDDIATKALFTPQIASQENPLARPSSPSSPQPSPSNPLIHVEVPWQSGKDKRKRTRSSPARLRYLARLKKEEEKMMGEKGFRKGFKASGGSDTDVTVAWKSIDPDV